MTTPASRRRRGGGGCAKPFAACWPVSGRAFSGKVESGFPSENATNARIFLGLRGPFVDDGDEGVEAVRERGGPRLQDQRRLDLAQPIVAHRRDGGKARARRDLRRHELLAAPRADDDVGGGGDHVAHRYDALRGILLPRALGEYLDAARDLDELRDPADAGDHRL